MVTGEGLGERRIGSKYAVSNSQGIDKSVDKDEEGWLLRNSTHGWHLSTHRTCTCVNMFPSILGEGSSNSL